MRLDLLRLVSMGQNMDLYASLQIRQPPQTNANQQEHHSAQSSRQPQRPRQTTNSNSNHNNQPSNSYHNQSQNFYSEPHAQPQDYRPPTRETNKQQTAHCKPLDLSLKSTQSTFSHQDPSLRFKSEHDAELQQKPLTRHRKTRPAPHKRSFVEKCANEEEEEELKFEESVQQQRSSCIKLISSSTSPSSTSSSFAASSCSSSSSCSTRLTRISCSSNEEVSTVDQSKISPATHEIISTSTDSGNQRSSGCRSGKRQKSLKGDGQVKNHLCLQCGRSFSRSDMLTRHSRLHSGLKPYQCGKCKQVFSRSDHLSTHERTHTGEKPYQCEQCAYSACRRDMITRHMRTHNSTLSSLASGVSHNQRVGTELSTARRMKRKLSMTLSGSNIEQPNSMDDYAIVDGSSDQLHHNINDMSTSLNGENEEEGEQIEDEEVQDLGLRF